MDTLTNEKLNTDKIFLKNLKSDFEYQNQAILIKTILREQGANIILFIIDEKQGLMEHSASSDAIVYILEGNIEFKVSEKNYCLTEGNVMKLQSGIPHSFIAVEKTKMLLIIFN